jgi:asparagine synthase (glutamine-hydrolysing)
MARIAGYWERSRTPPPESDVQQMLSAARTGRDTGSHVQSTGACTVGWVGRGDPLVTEHAHLLVAVDGTFYNRADLGDGNEAEILARLVARSGLERALGRINGNFAVAVYDKGTDRLSLARDRFGVRPLYYSTTGRGSAFASRPRSLLALPEVGADVNPRWVARFAGSHYRAIDNHPDESPYAHIRQLPAGHILEVDRNGLRVTRYWDLVEEPDLSGSEADLADEYRQRLIDAVAIRFGAADRSAFLLSGGMDSSTVVASAASFSRSKQTAFSSVYADPTFDESQDIQPMLEHSVGDWRPVPVGDPDVFAILDEMVKLHDEPVATATWLSHYLVVQEAAAAGFSSLFGGLGGDELNAGEYEYFTYHFADLCYRRDPTFDAEVREWARHHDHPIYKKSPEVAAELLSRLVDLSQPGRCLPDTARLTRYRDALHGDLYPLSPSRLIMDHPFSSYLKNRTYQDLFRETLPCCLRAEDRNSTALGIEHHDPFLDHTLVEFAFRVPSKLKIRHGVTKILLRQATAGLLPEETRRRIKKTGWNAPAHVWFTGASAEPLGDLISSQEFAQRGVYDVATVKHLFDEHQQVVASGDARENHMMFFWQLVNLELWFRSLGSRT